MRMWMVDPGKMCRQHLLGEHRELHALAGSLRLGRSIAGHLARGQLEPQNMNFRHDALVAEMKRRGYNHLTPLEDMEGAPTGHVDRDGNIEELARRCVECRIKMKGRQD